MRFSLSMSSVEIKDDFIAQYRQGSKFVDESGTDAWFHQKHSRIPAREIRPGQRVRFRNGHDTG